MADTSFDIVILGGGPGGYVDSMGYDLSLTRVGLEILADAQVYGDREKG